MSRRSHRREFLAGKSAVDALDDLVDNLAPIDTSPPACPAAAPLLVHFGRPAMGTRFEVYLNARQHSDGGSIALAALDLIEELEEQLSVYRESSELSQINRTAHASPVAVERRLFELFMLAQTLRELTAGAIDMTAGPLSRVWGFLRRQGAVPDESELAAALACVGGQHLELDLAEQTVRFARPGMEINLGAIGKGYALDRVAEAMLGAGLRDFLIHGGRSSVLALGSPATTPDVVGWTVGVQHPLHPQERLATVRLNNRALGTSADTHQHLRHRGRRLGHILDPRTGWPAEGVLQATVRAESAAIADALSTAFFVLGWELARNYCEQHPGIAAILVLPGEREGSIQTHACGFATNELEISHT